MCNIDCLTSVCGLRTNLDVDPILQAITGEQTILARYWKVYVDVSYFPQPILNHNSESFQMYTDCKFMFSHW